MSISGTDSASASPIIPIELWLLMVFYTRFFTIVKGHFYKSSKGGKRQAVLHGGCLDAPGDTVFVHGRPFRPSKRYGIRAAAVQRQPGHVVVVVGLPKPQLFYSLPSKE